MKKGRPFIMKGRPFFMHTKKLRSSTTYPFYSIPGEAAQTISGGQECTGHILSIFLP